MIVSPIMTTQSAVGIGGLNEDRGGDLISTRLDYGPIDYVENYAHYYKQKIHPIVAPNLNQENSIHTFQIGSDNNPYFIDLQEINCDIDWRVVKEDGTRIDDTDMVSIVNSFSHSLFEQIDVFINGQQISDHARYAHFRSFLTNALSISSKVKKNLLKTDFWHDDDWDGNIKITPDSFSSEKGKGETGIINRSKIIEKSRTVNSYFKPHFDLATCSRDLPGNTELKLVFTMASSDFLLLHTTQKRYKVEVIKFELEVGRYLPPKSIEKIVESKKKSGLLLPFTRTTVRKREVNIGLHDLILPRLLEGDNLPFSIVIVPLTNYQLYSAEQNPYCWKQNNISRFSLLHNGTSLPLDPLKLGADFTSYRAFKHCMDSIGWKMTSASTPGITAEAWQGSKFFMGWNITSCFCSGDNSINIIISYSLSFRSS